jgi:hypothetical protein
VPIPTTAFAVRFTFNSIVLDFDEPALAVIPAPFPIAAANRAYSGKTEWLFSRIEHRLTLSWGKLSKAKIEECYTFWTWYAQGKQTAIILDRLGTATDQAEYALFNNFFTRAEPPDLTIPPFPAGRTVLERPFYTFGPISFRQGNA